MGPTHVAIVGYGVADACLLNTSGVAATEMPHGDHKNCAGSNLAASATSYRFLILIETVKNMKQSYCLVSVAHTQQPLSQGMKERLSSIISQGLPQK